MYGGFQTTAYSLMACGDPESIVSEKRVSH